MYFLFVDGDDDGGSFGGNGDRGPPRGRGGFGGRFFMILQYPISTLYIAFST